MQKIYGDMKKYGVEVGINKEGMLYIRNDGIEVQKIDTPHNRGVLVSHARLYHANIKLWAQMLEAK